VIWRSGTTGPPSTMPSDYDIQFRRLNRVTLAGDIPVDVHGRHSRAVAGEHQPFLMWSAPPRWRG
jgi:hypothetical protein